VTTEMFSAGNKIPQFAQFQGIILSLRNAQDDAKTSVGTIYTWGYQSLGGQRRCYKHRLKGLLSDVC